MLKASTLQLLRFHFSFFLMPVFWFALSQVDEVNVKDSMLLFFILHILIYPASNGYNSYMDKDCDSIGGIKNPLPPTKELFYITLIMDVAGVLLGFYISWYAAVALLGFIAASRAYSYRGIRLKKYAFISFFTTAIFQGGVIYFLTYHSCSTLKIITVSFLPMVACTLLVGSFYPLTQIYQHKQDEADGVKTLSMVLGYKGTFIFSSIIFFAAMCCIGIYFYLQLNELYFYIIALFNTPVLIYFFWWFLSVLKNNSEANFVNTMRMNIVASICTNAAFIAVLLIEKF